MATKLLEHKHLLDFWTYLLNEWSCKVFTLERDTMEILQRHQRYVWTEKAGGSLPYFIRRETQAEANCSTLGSRL